MINPNKKYAVTGNPIMHSLSPDLFKFWNEKYSLNIQYTRLISGNPNNILDLSNKLNINYLNITSPYKSKFFHLAEMRDLSSYLYYSTNFLNINEKKGYNFDVIGLTSIINKYKINVKSSKILILGAGDTARLIIDSFKQYNNPNVTIYNRTIEKAIKISNIKRINYIDKITNINEFDIIISTIPDFREYFDLKNITNSMIIIDVNYQIKKEVPSNIIYINGLNWLIYQAIPVLIMLNKILPDFDSTLKFLNGIERKKDKIILVGFSGTGKTSIGKKLAKKLNYAYMDTDELIETYTGLSIPLIFEKFGEEYFRNLESQIIDFLKNSHEIVISTGGGVVDNYNNFNILNDLNDIIYIYSDLKTSLDRIDINTRPIIKSKSESEIENLFNLRKEKYFSISDGIVHNDSDESSIVELLYENYR